MFSYFEEFQRIEDFNNAEFCRELQKHYNDDMGDEEYEQDSTVNKDD